MTDAITITPEPYDAPDGARLRAAMEAELHGRYGGESEPGEKPSAEDVLVFLVARDGAGDALGCGALRRLDATTVEVKRMYVAPEGRGRGLSKRLLTALEAEAAARGATVVRLETGPLQPEAIGLYTRAGYGAIPCWGAYAGEPNSVCFERKLG